MRAIFKTPSQSPPFQGGEAKSISSAYGGRSEAEGALWRAEGGGV